MAKRTIKLAENRSAYIENCICVDYRQIDVKEDSVVVIKILLYSCIVVNRYTRLWRSGHYAQLIASS